MGERSGEGSKIADLDQRVDALSAGLTAPTDEAGSRLRLVEWARVPAVEMEVWKRHVRYARTREIADREALVERYADHAKALARRFYRNREALDDLEQVALEGLLMAIERFDPSRGMPFLGFANPTIIGCLKRYYRDAGWAVRVPRRVHELSRPLRDAQELLSQDLGRTPTPSEIADLLGLDEAVVRDAMLAESVRATGSLDLPAGEEGMSIEHALGVYDPGLERVENRQALVESLRLLPEEDRELLQLYYGDQLTQSEIAGRLGVSQMQISRSLDRIVKRLRSHIPNNP
jgi:RNA polymerase sigma-B factor